MQNIYFGPDERAHQKFLDFFYIVCGLLCLALAILSLFPAGAGMRFFPLIFFIAAIFRAFSDADGDCHVGSYLCEWDLYLGVNENERENSGAVASVQ